MKRILVALLLASTAAHAQAPVWLSSRDGVPWTATNPLPVTVGSSTGAPTTVANATVTYGPAAVSQVTAGGTAVNALTAGSIKNGCDLLNAPTATTPLFFSLVGTASTTLGGGTMQLAPGQAYHCPFGTATALSVNATDAGHFFGAMGY